MIEGNPVGGVFLFLNNLIRFTLKLEEKKINKIVTSNNKKK